jgi:hypothetical protein
MQHLWTYHLFPLWLRITVTPTHWLFALLCHWPNPTHSLLTISLLSLPKHLSLKPPHKPHLVSLLPWEPHSKIHHSFLRLYHSLYSDLSYKDLLITVSPSISYKIFPNCPIWFVCDPKVKPSSQSTVVLMAPNTCLPNGYLNETSLCLAVGSMCLSTGFPLPERGVELIEISSCAHQHWPLHPTSTVCSLSLRSNPGNLLFLLFS